MYMQLYEAALGGETGGGWKGGEFKYRKGSAIGRGNSLLHTDFCSGDRIERKGLLCICFLH